MTTFDYIRFTEEWAAHYKPMQHTMKSDMNRHFFITDSYMTMVDFMAHHDPDTSPCIIAESQQEGEVEDGLDYPRYSFYFMVRADEMNDGKEAVASKRTAKHIMLDFVNFIRAFKYANEDTETYAPILNALTLEEDSYLYELREAVLNGSRCMENINVENFSYESINQMHDGWYGIQFSLEDKQLFGMCADTSMYL